MKIITMNLIDRALNSFGYSKVESEKRGFLEDSFEDVNPTGKVTITSDNAMKLSAVYNAVRVYTDAISSMPIHVIKETKDSKVKDYNHPAYNLVAKEPNSLMTSFTWRQISIPHILLKGNSYSVIDWDKKTMRPKSFMPVHPSKVKVEVKKGIALYTIQLTDSKTITLDQSNVLHFRGLGDEIMGKSVIDYAKDNLELAQSTETFGNNYFSQGANYGAVYEHPMSLSDKAHNNLQKSLERRANGLSKAHKILILEEGMKINKTVIPNNHAQFIETRKFGVNDIARWFKLPPHMLQDLERATFSNIEQQDLNFVKHSLLPYLVMIEQELNRKLLREDEKANYYFKINIEGLLRGDIKTRAEAYQVFIQNGIMSPNEARRKEDLDPYSEGNDFWMPLNIGKIKDNNGVATPPTK